MVVAMIVVVMIVVVATMVMAVMIVVVAVVITATMVMVVVVTRFVTGSGLFGHLNPSYEVKQHSSVCLCSS